MSESSLLPHWAKKPNLRLKEGESIEATSRGWVHNRINNKGKFQEVIKCHKHLDQHLVILKEQAKNIKLKSTETDKPVKETKEPVKETKTKSKKTKKPVQKAIKSIKNKSKK